MGRLLVVGGRTGGLLVAGGVIGGDCWSWVEKWEKLLVVGGEMGMIVGRG